jgi:hypothetical protein
LTLRYWEAEAPDLKASRQTLEDIVEQLYIWVETICIFEPWRSIRNEPWGSCYPLYYKQAWG